jgi:uracil-DNA glycosylase
MRCRGLDVPNLDPNDGGVNARALFLLETPGPRAVGTGFISRDNPDPSARNMGRVLDDAGFLRSEVVLWNVVPNCVSTVDENRNVSIAQIRDAVPASQAFIDCLARLRVVVFCGRKAQRAAPFLRFPAGVEPLSTFHPGARSYNRSKCRDHMHMTFKQAHGLIAV